MTFWRLEHSVCLQVEPTQLGSLSLDTSNTTNRVYKVEPFKFKFPSAKGWILYGVCPTSSENVMYRNSRIKVKQFICSVIVIYHIIWFPVPNLSPYFFIGAAVEDANILKQAEIIVADNNLLGLQLYNLPAAKWVQGTWAGVDTIMQHYDASKVCKFQICKLGKFMCKMFAQTSTNWLLKCKCYIQAQLCQI
jgi:hypothetical protein